MASFEGKLLHEVAFNMSGAATMNLRTPRSNVTSPYVSLYTAASFSTFLTVKESVQGQKK